MKIKPLIGAYGKMPILIRDDDTNFFTRPDYLGDLTFGWKTTYLELYNRAMKVQKINISKIGSKITVEYADNELTNEVSFQINGRIAEPNENTEFEKETNIVTIKQILPRSKFVLCK